ncbi:MAG: hypothetical protein J7L75_04300, partial [Thermoproteales archaeon]|nr:hypothetical protein [Thermoproteales archaeon]
MPDKRSSRSSSWEAEAAEKLGQMFEKAAAADREKAQLLAKDLLKGAQAGGEVNSENWEEWIEKRVEFQLVLLDLNDYLTALIRALWLAPRFAPIDFRTASQRDFAQIWSDTSRGFLGEIAVQKFLSEKLQLKVRLSRRRGELEEFLPSDIEEVFDKKDQKWRKPKVN